MTFPLNTGDVPNNFDFTSTQVVIKDILGLGDNGWGLSFIESDPVYSGMRIDAAQWNKLLYDVNTVYQHVHTVFTSTTSVTTGSTVINHSFPNDLYSTAQALVGSRYTVDPSQFLTAYSGTSTVFYTGGDSVRTISWGGTSTTYIVQNVISHLPNNTFAKYYFNQGCYFSFTPYYSGLVLGGSIDVQWVNFIDYINTNDPYTFDRTKFMAQLAYPGIPSSKTWNWTTGSLQVIVSAELKTDLSSIEFRVEYDNNNTSTVGVQIGCGIGYNLVGRGRITGPVPMQSLIYSLDGATASDNGYNSSTRLLSVNTLDTFSFAPGNTSTVQTVSMTNNGNVAMTITNILYSTGSNVSPQFYFSTTTTILNSSTITIASGTTATFGLAYYGTAVGEYSSYFTIVSNNSSGNYKVNTRQSVVETVGFNITPTSISTNITNVGQNKQFTYDVIPVVNGQNSPELAITPHITYVGTSGWTYTTSTNKVVVNFNPNVVSNATGTYISTLTVSSNGGIRSVINTATISIDRTANKNLSTWLSPASRYNSIVGISYDLKDNQRYLTIGVGTGADGSEIYGLGGSSTISLSTLGLGAESLSSPYTYWSKVYNIPFSTGSDAQVYYSNDHVVKTTTASDYSSYFGQDRSQGSMFVVEDDGYGSIKVEINYLRDILSTDTVDAATTATLHNLTRAFHYYSNVDMLGRYAPLPTAYSNPIVTDTSTTYLFVGFNYNTRDKLANTNTSIVALPL